MISDVPPSLTRNGFRRGVKWMLALIVWMSMNKIEDPVGSGSGTVDEIGPRHGALRWSTRSQISKTACGTHFGKVGQQALLHHG